MTISFDAAAYASDSPVTRLPGDPVGSPEPGIGLCLSGGGYRAMLFHLGALLRLNELGYLPKLDRISSVSGGSITAGVLGLKWDRLEFVGGVARNFDAQVIEPIRRLAGETVDTSAILSGTLLPGTIGEKVAAAYREHLFGDATLQALPDRPRFVINASNVQSGALWRFSKPYMRDYRVGELKNPELELAVAVAASSAFPPFLSPVELTLDPAKFTPGSGLDLQREPFTSKVMLTDGGVYDNLGLETVWKRYETILVSDAGGTLGVEEEPHGDWPRHVYRVLFLIDNQVRALRKRQLIDAFKRGARKGAYFGIRSNLASYGFADSPEIPLERSIELANTPTRLKSLPDETRVGLIAWGRIICDAALRRHVIPGS
jgi:NTE family protein